MSEHGRHDLKIKRCPSGGFGNNPLWISACPFSTRRRLQTGAAGAQAPARANTAAPTNTARSNRESGLRLEISEDESGQELVYRFVDARTGEVVREWDAGEFGKLREYARAQNIHLLDTKA